ncbi:hypothetical protein [Streptomyces sp. NPDC057677]|uniref:hypothetical protein n=1 Tax=unclassified Streptomyces TaxID=2593676 RepID=UPI0036841F68
MTGRIAEIQARYQAASRGPWSTPKPGILLDADGNTLAVFGGCAQDEDNVQFLTHAADDIQYLLNRLAQAQAAS